MKFIRDIIRDKSKQAAEVPNALADVGPIARDEDWSNPLVAVTETDLGDEDMPEQAAQFDEAAFADLGMDSETPLAVTEDIVLARAPDSDFSELQIDDADDAQEEEIAPAPQEESSGPYANRLQALIDQHRIPDLAQEDPRYEELDAPADEVSASPAFEGADAPAPEETVLATPPADSVADVIRASMAVEREAPSAAPSPFTDRMPKFEDPAQSDGPAESAAEVAMPQTVAVPPPAAGRSGQRAGRAKTRLLGFNTSQDTSSNPFDKVSDQDQSGQAQFPVGWLVVVAGPGRGSSFTLFHGVSQIGRGEDQAIRLDFGDNSISRSNHAAIAYDPEKRMFFLGHGGKANLVRLNDTAVLSTEQLGSGSHIRIGETTLQFIALCDEEFDWADGQDDGASHAAFG